MTPAMPRADDFVQVLTDLGVEVHTSHGDEITARCPMHHKIKGRESSGFSFYFNVSSGLWHCFTCGAKGNLSMLLADLAADPMVLWSLQTQIVSSGLRRLTAEEAVYNVGPEVDWIKYSKFVPLPDGVLTYRRFDPVVADRYGIRWDMELKATIAPIMSKLGELWGWQAKKTGWVRNVPSGVQMSKTLFGIERGTGSTAVLVESPLDVVRFHSAFPDTSISCLSSFGVNVSQQQVDALNTFNTVIVALDNDRAGRNETNRLRRLHLLQPRRQVLFWNYEGTAKDIGEMLDDEIVSGIERSSVVPRNALRVPG